MRRRSLIVSCVRPGFVSEGSVLHLQPRKITNKVEAFMSTILLIVLVLLLLGALPTWPYSRSWGYYPSGGLGLVVVILLVLLVAGRL